MKTRGLLAILKQALPLPHLRNERGMLLVLVMIIMLVVSSLAAANMVNSLLERNLAKNQNYGSLALQAAEAGIADGITWLNVNQALLPAAAPWADNANWPKEVANGRAITRDLSRDLNGDGDTLDPGEKLGRYTVTLRYKREWRDYSNPVDGDCVDPGESSGYKDADGSPSIDCPGDIVLFNNGSAALNNGFGFTGAQFSNPGEGFPVVEIDAIGTYGSAGYREAVLDVSRNKLAAQVDGAFTARSGVSATGASNIDGQNRTLTGALDATGSCGGNKPGILVDNGVFPNADLNADGDCNDPGEGLPCDLNCDGDCGDGVAESNLCGNATGTPCWDTHLATAPPLPTTPWGVLGLPSQDEFEDMFTSRTDTVLDQPCSTDQYYLWYKSTGGVHFNNSSACNNYNGILVIHNEKFDPDQWEACAGTYCTDDVDPADGVLDHAPAVFDMNGNVQWTGVVIADQVVQVNGNPVIRGGIISLASGGVINTSITGNIDIQFSCEAVTGATNQGYKTRLAWHRLR